MLGQEPKILQNYLKLVTKTNYLIQANLKTTKLRSPVKAQNFETTLLKTRLRSALSQFKRLIN